MMYKSLLLNFYVVSRIRKNLFGISLIQSFPLKYVQWHAIIPLSFFSRGRKSKIVPLDVWYRIGIFFKLVETISSFPTFDEKSLLFFNYEVFSEKLIVKKFEEIPTIYKLCVYYNMIAILLAKHLYFVKNGWLKSCTGSHI